jgi:hypothetical protein
MIALQQLVDDAVMLADPSAYAHAGRTWDTEGGRPCPIDWFDCSQPVFVDRVTGAHDYGAAGGPGHAWCRDNCSHGMQPHQD